MLERDEATYDCHAPSLYRQAWLTLDDADLAEQVVSDVIVEECVRPAALSQAGSAGTDRLAVEVYRRCQDLAARTSPLTRAGQRSSRAFPDCLELSLLSCRDREHRACALRGLGCQQASRELAIRPADLLALLCAILGRLAVRGPEGTRQATGPGF